MMKAAIEADAEKSKESFEKLFSDKNPKSVECLSKSWTELTTFFHYPARHWQHIWTTNPIESSFATEKHRTKGSGSKVTAAVMAFKLLNECQKKWRKLRGHEEFKKLLKEVEFKNGLMMPHVQHQEHAAS